MSNKDDVLNKNAGLTFEQARKRIENMTFVNNFLFNSVMENPETAKEVSKIVISTVIGHEVTIKDVIAEKVVNGIDTGMHGVRFDALIVSGSDALDENGNAEVAYDFEAEDREADRPGLPRRQRYYSAMVDSKLLESGAPYETLPDYVSITVLSYDPFYAGDMYYEAKTVLTSHPNLCYDDGRTNYFFYGLGRNNLPAEKFDNKTVAGLMRYIVTGEKADEAISAVDKLDSIIRAVKRRTEVTKRYMKEWDRQRLHDIELTREVTERVTEEVTEQVRGDDIRLFANLMNKQGIPDDKIQDMIKKIESAR